MYALSFDSLPLTRNLTTNTLIFSRSSPSIKPNRIFSHSNSLVHYPQGTVRGDHLGLERLTRTFKKFWMRRSWGLLVRVMSGLCCVMVLLLMGRLFREIVICMYTIVLRRFKPSWHELCSTQYISQSTQTLATLDSGTSLGIPLSFIVFRMRQELTIRFHPASLSS